MSSLSTLLGSIVPLSLLAALSPVLLFNSTELLTTRGKQAALGFLAGIVTVLVVIAGAGAGLLGAGLARWINTELTSRFVDGVLAGLLAIYAGHMIAQLRRQEKDPAQARATSKQQSPFVFGLISMGTNYTTLPLVLAASQHIGATGRPFWEALPLVALVIALTAAPVWLPFVIAQVAPGLLTKLTHRKKKHSAHSIGFNWEAWIPIGACVLGAGALALHAAGLWNF